MDQLRAEVDGVSRDVRSTNERVKISEEKTQKVARESTENRKAAANLVNVHEINDGLKSTHQELSLAIQGLEKDLRHDATSLRAEVDHMLQKLEGAIDSKYAPKHHLDALEDRLHTKVKGQLEG